MPLFLVNARIILNINILVKLVKMEIHKLIVRHVNQVNIEPIKVALENAFAIMVFMMIH